MCVIIACPKSVTPKRADLLTACDQNPHGFGWAVAVPGEMLTRYSMNAVEAVDAFLKLRGAFPRARAMFHARIATHSNVDIRGCHPYAVPGTDAQVVIAHNGMLTQCEPGPCDDRSDTQVFVEDVLPRNGGPESLWRWPVSWEDWLGSANKVVMLSSIPNTQHMIILNAHRGYWHDGAWWSNRSWESYTAWWSKSTRTAWEEEMWEKDAKIWPAVTQKASCALCARPSVREILDTALCAECTPQFEEWEEKLST